MSNTNTGGPAFPCPRYFKGIGPDGMTLRDYFAAKVVNGIMADQNVMFTMGKGPLGAAMEIATSAYDIADAMLKAREA